MENSEIAVTEAVRMLNESTPDFGLIILAALTLLLVGFSLLMYRQARQMIHVLPTPLSPMILLIVFGYALLTIGAFVLIIINIM